ncbi:MAG TPA: hypothetical protein VFM31_05890 [Nitrososphaeraceae archaeon]|nr:hypothetical protein [Nitrososphaeraceae archaeon]
MSKCKAILKRFFRQLPPPCHTTFLSVNDNIGTVSCLLTHANPAQG